MVTATLPNLIAFDLYAVQPMDNRIGMINYLDYTYQSNKGAVTEGQIFNGALKGSFSDKDYTSAFVNGEKFKGDGNVTDFYLAWTPVDTRVTTQIGESVLPIITVDGSPVTVEIDNGQANPGALVSANGLVKFATAPAAPSDPNESNIVVKYWFLNEDVRSNGFGAFGGPNNGNQAIDGATGAAGFTNVPEIGLKMQTVPVEAKARTLRAYWAFDAQYELSKEYGQSIEDLLATQASGEIAHEIDNELTLDLLKSAIGNTNPDLYMRSWSKVQPMGVSLADHYDGFVEKIIDCSNAINAATRKVSANFMVCGLGVATVVKVMRTFQTSGNIANGPYFLGTLGDIKVYVNPDYPSDYFVMGYKGTNMFDAGAFYLPYMPVTSTDTIMTADFRGEKAWATMYAKKILNKDMYIAGQITK